MHIYAGGEVHIFKGAGNHSKLIWSKLSTLKCSTGSMFYILNTNHTTILSKQAIAEINDDNDWEHD